MISMARFVSFGCLGAIALAAGAWFGSRGGDGSAQPAGAPTGQDEVLEEEMAALLSPAPSDAAIARAQVLAVGNIEDVFAEISELVGAAEQLRAWFDVVSAMDAKGIERLMEFFLDGGKDLEDAFLGDIEVLLAVFERWAVVDGDGVFEFFGGRSWEGSDLYRGTLVELGWVALFALGQRDYAKALALADVIEQGFGEEAEELRIYAIFGLCQSNPAEAVRAIVEMPGDDGGEMDSDETLGYLGTRSGEALPAVLAVDDPKLRARMIRELFGGWADSDPHAAFGAALSLEDDEVRTKTMHSTLSELAVRDPGAAVSALASTDESQREEFAKWMVASWAGQDPAAALAWARENLKPAAFGETFSRVQNEMEPDLAASLYAEMRAADPKSVEGVGAGFLTRYLQADPAAALGWLEENPTNMLAPSRVGKSAGEGLAQRGADAVREAAEGLPAGALRKNLVGTALQVIAFEDPQAAHQLLADLGEGESTHALGTLGVGWGAKDPVAAAEFARAHGDEHIFAAAVGNWARHEPGDAYRWLVESKDADADAVAGVLGDSGLAKTWAEREPGIAAGAMLGLPEDLAATHVGEVVGVWTQRDPDAVAEFIDDRLETGSVRDRAVVELIKEIKDHDPNGAAAWARTISDEATMTSALDFLATE